MKFGVLGFSYTGFTGMEDQLSQQGNYTVNLGDNAQSIATRHVYRQLGVPDDEMVLIDRDALTRYDGPPALLVMNGVFYGHSLPTPPQITPIFIGFRADEEYLRQHSHWLKRWEPIGCRDTETTECLLGLGVEAYTSGCITMLLPPRSTVPSSPQLLIVYGEGAGALPGSVLPHIPSKLAERAVPIFHRLPQSTFPMSPRQCAQAELYEQTLLNRYRDEATLVLTSLLHVASPCIAMRVPVVLCRSDRSGRFSLIESLIPLYTPDLVHQIDWAPAPVRGIELYQSMVVERLRAALG